MSAGLQQRTVSTSVHLLKASDLIPHIASESVLSTSLARVHTVGLLWKFELNGKVSTASCFYGVSDIIYDSLKFS